MSYRKKKKFWTKQRTKEVFRLTCNPFDASAMARYVYAVENISELK